MVELAEKVDVAGKKIGVRGIKQDKDEAVFVDCSSDQDAEKLRVTVAEKMDTKARELKKSNPMVCEYDVDESLTVEKCMNMYLGSSLHRRTKNVRSKTRCAQVDHKSKDCKDKIAYKNCAGGNAAEAKDVVCQRTKISGLDVKHEAYSQVRQALKRLLEEEHISGGFDHAREVATKVYVIMASGYSVYEEEHAWEFRGNLVRNAVTKSNANISAVIIGLDANNKSRLWNSPMENWRGRELETDIAGVINFTAVDFRAYGMISGWHLSDDETLSDNKPISFEISSDINIEQQQTTYANRKIELSTERTLREWRTTISRAIEEPDLIVSRQVVGRCPHASRSGPGYSNILNNNIFELDFGEGCEVILFADTMLLVRARQYFTLKGRSSNAFSKILDWNGSRNVVHADDEEIHAERLKLDRVYGNYQAELVAIEAAVKHVKEMQIGRATLFTGS
ncbi:hypothetical protein Trydic_g4187 [Trypoxylus dichotomus]